MDPQPIDNEQQGIDNNNPNVAQPQADVRTNLEAFNKKYPFWLGMPIIGEGAFGRVYKGYDTEEDTEVALKQFQNGNNDQLQSFMRELRILTIIKESEEDNEIRDNGHTVPFVCYHSNPQMRSPSFLVLGLMDRTLHYEVQLKKQNELSLSFDEIRDLGRQIARGLKYLETNLDIIHADLKPANLMFANDYSNQLRIIDFGHAFVRTNYNYHHIQTAEYRAMEVFLERGPYTNAIDIWSFGCILVYMYTAKHLFTSNIDRERKIVHQIVRTLGMPPEELMLRNPICYRYFTYDDGQWKTKRLWLWEEDGIEPRRRNVEQFLNANRKQEQTEEFRNFVELIEQMLDYNVNSRIRLAHIIDHPFLTPPAPRRCRLN